MDSMALRQAWEEHPYFRYRGCAPDVDEPGRAAGDLSLSLDAWHGEDRDGPEEPREREARQAAAVEVCLSCPVMVQCDAYASSVVVEGGQARLAEPAGIWGGRTALERHRVFIRQRHEVAVPAPVRLMRTRQKLRVLEALARHVDAEAVAAAAGMDVRTANWQRSRLVTQLSLDKRTATRAELLEAAVERGLLDGSLVVADDGSVPAVPPPAAPPRVASSLGVVEGSGAVAPAVLKGRVRRPRRVQVIPGQLVLFGEGLAGVVSFPVSEPLEAAA
ncbi:WhiB family transcriptional regulator [Streptomyces leeuwenhoekii]|uniref:Sle1_031 protein n=1 Tax=Streptomyces leeuwenhoekii TaxID=1437453 RepID=A0A0F7VMC6_STRLW|nr:WhiB family transcriptional regulator [Streptomyces leeuwenhoekii]CQR59198.1 sle1_031 [Streptomyces leeuwenhoekii]